MEQTKHVRLSGHADAFALTAPAHEHLLRYLAEARAALVADPDGDETVRDLEATLGEHLRLILDASEGPVGDTQLAPVLAQVGAVDGQQSIGVPPEAQSLRGPFWCRIDEHKWFGGVCAGIAARGDLRLDWVRTFGVLLMLVTAGLIGFVYLALILLLPRVATLEEYRRLRDAPRADGSPPATD